MTDAFFLLGKLNLFFIVLIRIISCRLHNLIVYVLALLTVSIEPRFTFSKDLFVCKISGVLSTCSAIWCNWTCVRHCALGVLFLYCNLYCCCNTY